MDVRRAQDEETCRSPNRLCLLRRDTMSVNPCVLTDADDLPRDFHSRLIGLDDKAIVGGSAVTGDECGFHLALFLE